MLDKIKMPEGYKLIYLSEFGSNLFGTNSETSDKDYKGLFIPAKMDVLCKKDILNIQMNSNTNIKSRNTSEDIDIELWSIYKFFNLIQKSDTIAIELLFSMFREDTQTFKTSEVDFFKENYEQFLSKNIKGFIGYCFKQSEKYGLKSKRYMQVLEIYNYLENFEGSLVSDFYNEYSSKLGLIKKIDNDQEWIEVLGKKYSFRIKIIEFKQKIKGIIDLYGNRVKSAADNENIEWKSLSHSFRILFETKELLKDEFIVFPLRESEFVKQVKYFSKKEDMPELMKRLQKELEEVNELELNSSLPTNVQVEDLLKSFIKIIYKD